MNKHKHIKYLQCRRKLLVSQAAAQRTELCSIGLILETRWRRIDTALTIVRRIRAHPVLAVAGAALLFPAPLNKLIFWGTRLLAAWKVFSQVRQHWQVSR